MDARRDIDEEAAFSFVSTGRLPPPELARALVAEAHERYRTNTEGANSRVYPALARVPSGLFGVCLAGASTQPGMRMSSSRS